LLPDKIIGLSSSGSLKFKIFNVWKNKDESAEKN